MSTAAPAERRGEWTTVPSVSESGASTPFDQRWGPIRVLDALMVAALRPAPEVASALPPPLSVSLGGLGAPLFLVLVFWEVASQVDTMAHEGAHAAAMMIFGEGVSGVEIDVEADEFTGKTIPAHRDPSVPARMVGYHGPSLFGLLGAALLVQGSATAVLWIFIFLIGLLLLVVRNLFGALIVLGTGASIYLTVTYGSPSAQVFVAYAWVWLLLLAGVVTAFHHRGSGSDYHLLQEATFFIPRIVWALLALIISLAALYVGGSWLLGFSRP